MGGKHFEGSDISDDVKAKARAASSAEELATIARREGLELSDEQLEQISGGWKSDPCMVRN